MNILTPEVKSRQESLMERTRRLLHESDESVAAVAAGIVAANPKSRVNYYWLRKFSAGYLADPSVNRVEELYMYLTGEPVLAQTAS